MAQGSVLKTVVACAAMLITLPASPSPAADWGGEPSAVGSYLAGRFAERENDWVAAAQFLGTALARDPDNQSLRRRMFVLALAGADYDRAFDLADQLSSDHTTESGFAHLAEIARLLRKDDFRNAWKQVHALPDDGFNRLVKPLLTAWVSIGRGSSSAEAVEILRSAPTITRIESWFTLHAALLSEAAGDRAEAARWYERAASLSQGTSLRIAEALTSFLGRVGESPSAGEAVGSVAETGATAGGVVASRSEPRSVRVIDGVALALFDVANAMNQQESHDLALLMGRIALYLRPEFPLAWLLLGDVATERDRHEDALGFYRRAMDRGSPRIVRAAWLRSVESLHDLGRNIEALEEADRFLTRNPDDAEAMVRVGDLHRMTGDHARAITAYTRALRLMPANAPRTWRVYYGRALSHDMTGDWPSAEADFLAALRWEPDNALLLNYLGYSWADRGVHLERSRAMIEDAVKARPHDGFIVDSLGWVLFRLGDIEGAITHLERAVVLEPQDPTINDHLGDVYWQAGRRLEASYQWQRALKLAGEEDGSLVVAVRRKLEEHFGSSHAAEVSATP